MSKKRGYQIHLVTAIVVILIAIALDAASVNFTLFPNGNGYENERTFLP